MTDRGRIIRQGSSSRRTGFFASVPWPIEANWSPRYAHLAGFPVTLMYSGLRTTGEADPSRLVSSIYWFDPGSYREDETTRTLDYFPREESPYWLRISNPKGTSTWEVTKYRGEALVALAAGPDYEGAMIQATLVGIAPDEPESPEEGRAS